MSTLHHYRVNFPQAGWECTEHLHTLMRFFKYLVELTNQLFGCEASALGH
jgi:hypothetical protein